jgi:uncharacterized BrkB/YihY/UPF0761 family membrane protein
VKYPRIFLKSFADFFRDGGIVLAGSLSYFSMMALVPLCLFLITIFGYILGHYQGFYEFFSSKLAHFPRYQKESKELEKLIAFKGIGTLSSYCTASFPYRSLP